MRLRSRETTVRAVVYSAAVLFGLFVYACLPATVIPLDDDFGYLRSVVQTIQHGRPWTDDWLEPWAAGFSSISALLYVVTGNFQFATHGLLALLAMASFGFCFSLLQARGVRTPGAILLAAAGLTFPCIFWKLVQFTGMALYIPCLLAAVWAAQKSRWSVYLVAWVLALSTRQSALTWIVLPLYAAIAAGWPQRFRALPAWRAAARPLGVAAVGTLSFLALRVWMNKTHAQHVMTDRMFDHISFDHIWRNALIGVVTCLMAAGIGLLVGRMVQFAPPRTSSLRNPLFLTLAAVLVGVTWMLDLHTWIGRENPSFAGPAAAVYLKGLGLVAALGWSFKGGTVRPAFALSALASVALLSLRGAVWDYYFLDAIVFSLFGARLRPETTAEPAPATAGWSGLKRAAAAIAIAAGIANGLLLLDLKAHLDRSHALCVISEDALRARVLDPAEISYAPFGFQGWHLFPHFIREEGREAYIGGFDCYLREGAIEVGQGYSRPLHLLARFRHEPPGDRQNLVAEGSTAFLWAFHAEFYLLRFKTAAQAPARVALPRNYLRQELPLNEAEWRDYIAPPATRPGQKKNSFGHR